MRDRVGRASCDDDSTTAESAEDGRLVLVCWEVKNIAELDGRGGGEYKKEEESDGGAGGCERHFVGGMRGRWWESFSRQRRGRYIRRRTFSCLRRIWLKRE